MNLIDFVFARDGEAMTDSLRMARRFNKRHGDVLRAYKRLECSDEFRQRNFALVMESMTYVDSDGNTVTKQTSRISLIRMTKDGFIFMAMGFTGKEAARVKESYIGAFNAMVNELENVKLTFHRQMMALESRDANSFQWASWGSQKMLQRKRELPQIRSEYARLLTEAQPGLFAN